MQHSIQLSIQPGKYTIGTFAKAAGVHVETVRYYQRKDLLAKPEKPYGGIRRYGERELSRLRFIKTAQWLGFSLDEIANLLQLEDGTHCDDVSRIAEDKLMEVRKKLGELQRMENTLADLLDACRHANGNAHCPLIDSLQGVSLSKRR